MLTTLVALSAFAAHTEIPAVHAAPSDGALPIGQLAALASRSPRLSCLERRAARIEARERDLGRALPRQREVLLERYALAARDTLTQTRLGWLMLESDPDQATFEWLGALAAAPEGPHVDWAQLGLGEAARSRGDLPEASARYSAVVANGAPLAAHAAYRRAAVAFQMSRFEDAAADLVAASRAGEDSLRDAALRDLARAVVGEDVLRATERFDAACEGDRACIDGELGLWRAHREELGLGED